MVSRQQFHRLAELQTIKRGREKYRLTLTGRHKISVLGRRDGEGRSKTLRGFNFAKPVRSSSKEGTKSAREEREREKDVEK